MITDTQIKRAIRFATPVVNAHFDHQTAQTILSTMKANYKALAPEVPDFKSSFNQMMLKTAVDAVAYYRALLTELPQSEALTLIPPFVDNWMDGQFDRWIARFIFANRTLHLIYRKRWFNDVNRADEPDGQKFEFLPPSGDLYYGMNVVRCGLVKFLTRMGTPELAPLMCQGDYRVQPYLPKGVTFERTQLISEGGDHCDFRYYLADQR